MGLRFFLAITEIDPTGSRAVLRFKINFLASWFNFCSEVFRIRSNFHLHSPSGNKPLVFERQENYSSVHRLFRIGLDITTYSGSETFTSCLPMLPPFNMLINAPAAVSSPSVIVSLYFNFPA